MTRNFFKALYEKKGVDYKLVLTCCFLPSNCRLSRH